MSVISSFIVNQVIKALEDEFLNHSADIQESFVNEIETLASEIMDWVQSKIDEIMESKKDGQL